MKNLMTTIIAGSQYLLHPQKLGTIQETIKPDALIPITLLTTDEIFGDHLEATLEHFASYDDVFVPDFGDVLVEKTSANSTNSTSSRTTSAGHIYHLNTNQFAALDQIGELPSGPYILHGPNIYQAWKLYEDELDAFTFGVIPEDVNVREQYEALSSLSDNGGYKAIGVPSRLYYPPPTPERPLSGARIALTDSISVKGVGTTLSSRSYRDTYDDVSTVTAEFASKLVKMGAVLVGKTKTSSLLSGREWEDEQKPWNPRGDSFQNPSVNSAGAGSSLAGYAWVERVISQSSVEGFFDLASLNGLHSLRPTFDNSTLQGVQVSSVEIDTLDLNARSIEELQTLAAATLPSAAAQLPKRILYPTDYLPTSSTDNSSLLEAFVTSLEDSLALKAEHVDIGKLWSQHPPTDAKSQTLDTYLGEIPFKTYCSDYYKAFSDFRKGFEDRYHEMPFLEATTQYRWNIGGNITDTEYKAHIQRLDVFQHWFDQTIMKVTDADAVMVMPCASSPSYRTDNLRKPSSIKGADPEVLSAILGTPLIAAPFAQVPYTSKITNKTAYLPVCGGLMGTKKGDLSLIQTMKHVFQTAQWRTKVDVGETAFPTANSDGLKDSEQQSFGNSIVQSQEELR